MRLTIAVADALPVAIIVAVQIGHCKGSRPYAAHHFVDVLAKVRYVKNATSISQVRIHQVRSKTFKDRQCDLLFVIVHDTPVKNVFDSCMVLSLMHFNLCNCDHFWRRVFIRSVLVLSYIG